MLLSKQITVRVPVELVAEVEHRGAVAPFFVAAVREKLDRMRQEEIEESLLCLGEDPADNDISDWASMQAEVMARVD